MTDAVLTRRIADVVEESLHHLAEQLLHGAKLSRLDVHQIEQALKYVSDCARAGATDPPRSPFWSPSTTRSQAIDALLSIARGDDMSATAGQRIDAAKALIDSGSKP